MSRPLRVLAVHGIGLHDTDLSWQDDWRGALTPGLRRAGLEPELSFPLYDDLFRAEDLTAADVASALGRLLASGVVHGIQDLFSRELREPTARGRWVQGMSDRVRWTAGMVVQWADDAALREKLRARIREAIDEHEPQLIVAHSLGSLVTYDTLVRDAAAADGRAFVSFGSQIGNPFVRGTFAGRIRYPAGLRKWFHLYNPGDDVFTAPLDIPDTPEVFEQVLTPFDLPGIGDHDAPAYLGHDNTRTVWGALAEDPRRKAARGAFRAITAKPDNRALLIGIDAYPSAEDRLEGCVNDVYLMSATLQESGFRPEEIRTVLDERATADAIRSRLRWLLEGAKPGDNRLLYFSGHGAQLPGYGANEEVDRMDEVLVPVDFDWSAATAITDDDLTALYAQLPYSVNFAAIFDCCHSGGLTRAGSNRVRGIDPPDDIRHRAMRWDAVHEAWVPRPLEGTRHLRAYEDFLGAGRATSRIGTGVSLRRLPDAEYDREREELDHWGPYMPLIVQACRESELAYEYRHGVTSYGAFTYALTTILRRRRHRAEKPSFAELVEEASRTLAALGYDQRPKLDGPKSVKEAPIPYVIEPVTTVRSTRERIAELLDHDFETEAGQRAAVELYQLVEKDLDALDSEGPTARRADQKQSMKATFDKRFGLDWTDDSVAQPKKLEALVAEVEDALSGGYALRVVGAARSMSVASDPRGTGRGTVKPLSLLRLSTELAYSTSSAWQDPAHRTGRFQLVDGERDRLYRCEAGRSAKGVIDDIRRSRRSLENHGSGWFQGIVGALATGTHGSGATLPPLSGLVRAMTVVVPVSDDAVEVQLLMPTDDRRPYAFPDGVVEEDAAGRWIRGPRNVRIRLVEDTERFDATLIGLGCLGIVYAVTIEVAPRKIHLEEKRILDRWSEVRERLEDLVLHGGDRHLEVQVCPHHGHGRAGISAIAEGDHLVQLVRRTEVDAPLVGTPAHPLVQLGRLEAFAPGTIGNRVKKGLADPRTLPNGLVCSLTETSKWTRKHYIADILLLNLKYEGLGAEYAVPLSKAVVVADQLLSIARDHDDAAALVADGSTADKVRLWRGTPPLTAVLTLRFTSPDRALLSMAKGGTEPWCVFEIGMLGSPGLEKALREGDTSGDADELALYRAYCEGRKRLFDRLERALADHGARPHWGLYNRLTDARAGALWGVHWERWKAHYLAANRNGIFDNRFTDQLGISTRPVPHQTEGRATLRRKNDRLFLSFEGDLGWAMFRSLPSGSDFSDPVRKGTHLLATDRTYLPVVAELRFDEDGDLMPPVNNGRPTDWARDPSVGKATWTPADDLVEITGAAGAQLSLELHRRHGRPGMPPTTVTLRWVDRAAGTFEEA